MIIENSKFNTKSFDQRGTFPFSVVRKHHFDSNIPVNISYVTIGYETSRFARITADSNTFLTLANLLLKTI